MTKDWAAQLPPSPSDGPQEPVDWRYLEQEAHPLPPADADDG